MSLATPDPLDVSVVARALVRAQHGVALTCLTVAALTLLAIQIDFWGEAIWVALFIVLVTIGVLFVRWQIPSDLLTAAYLLVGGIALFTTESSKTFLAEGVLAGTGLGLLGVRIALVLCGSARASVGAHIVWTAAGYLVAEGAMLASSVATGKPYSFSALVLITAVVVIILRPLASHVSPRLRAAWPQLRRAAIEEHAANQRAILEQRAAALVHDTVLSQLTTIAGTSAGKLKEGLRESVARDVAKLTGDGWLADAHEADAIASAQWQHSPLFSALQDGRLLGLTIETTGDLQALRRVDTEAAMAIGLAVSQCLANVLKHAGTTVAEVAVYETAAEVCVMVIDTGRGFDQSVTSSDRLGLRASVKRRIEGIGGRVQVWSTLGQGTSIILRVPAAPFATDDESEQAVQQR